MWTAATHKARKRRSPHSNRMRKIPGKLYSKPLRCKGSFHQYMKNQTSFNVVEFEAPSKSKLERLTAISPKVESKKVYLVRGNWNDKFIDEITSNHPVFDDMRDCFIMAVNHHLVK